MHHTTLGIFVGTVAGSWFAESPLGGVTVSVKPQNGRALPTVVTAANGTFFVPNVPIDSSTVTFGNAPPGCTPFKQTFFVQFAGDTVDVGESWSPVRVARLSSISWGVRPA